MRLPALSVQKAGYSIVFGSRRRLRALLQMEQWERNVYAVTLAVFVAFSGFTLVMPFLPLYVRQLGVTDVNRAAVWSGLIFGVSPFVAGLMAPVWGSLADRYGRKPMFVRSLVAFTIIMLLTAFVTNVVQLFILRLIAGFLGGFGAMAMAMVTLSAPEERSSGAIGRLQATMLLTNASGPFAGGVLASTIGIRNTFFVSSALTAAALAVVVYLFREPQVERSRQAAERRPPLRRLILLPTLLPLALVLFLSQFVDRGLNPVLPLYVDQLGARPSLVAFWAGLLTSAGAVASALAAGYGGRLAATRSPRLLLLLSLAGGAVAAMALAVVQSVPQLLGARVLLGLLAGGSVTLAYSVGSRYLPRDARGASFGLLSTGSMLGGGLSPFVSGAIAAVSLRLVFLVGAVIYAVASLVALRLPDEPVEEAPETTAADSRSKTSSRPG